VPANTVKIRVDSWVDQLEATQSHPTASRLRLRGPGTNRVRRAYLFFGRPFPLGASVLAGILRLRVADDTWTSSTDVTLKRITSDWKESEVRYAKRPDVDDASAITVAVPASANGTEREFDITPLLEDVAAGEAWHGIEISIGTDGHRAFYSSDHENADRRPEVDIEWRKPPLSPLNLRPNDGAVSHAEPILAWENYLVDSEESQAYSRVQIDTTEDMATPIYDSGKVANVEPEWDTSVVGATTDWGAGASAGTTYYWRVMVWNDADQASEWSDVASFTLDAKPTLTITEPGVDGLVEETTPTITWDVTGGVQESREVQITKLPIRPGRGEAVAWERKVTTDEEVKVPPKFLVSGKTYRLEVRVWDDADRAWSPGDPPYLRQVRDFQYVKPAGGPPPVTDLVATVDPSSPAVHLAFSRPSGQPDYFSLRVDGEEVEDRIDASEASVGGDDYEYTYWGLLPREDSLIEVEAVVNNGSGSLRHSNGNDTATAQIDPTGIWLVDPDDDTAVRIIGPSDVSFEIREVGTTYDILSSRSPVRITEHVGGYSGTFNGQIKTKAARDTFLDLKGRLKELRLIAGDMNIPVILEEVSVNPSNEVPGDKVFPVEVSCFQSGEFARTFQVTGS
jgi:hypothetical protein